MKWILVIFVMLLAGCCPAATQVTADEAGEEGRSPRDVVAAFSAGVEAAGRVLGDQAAEIERARGVVALGDAALDACETGGGLLQWVRFALETVRTLIGLFGQREVSAPPPPPELLDAQRLLSRVAP